MKGMKQLVIVPALAALGVALAACGASPTPAEAVAAAPAQAAPVEEAVEEPVEKAVESPAEGAEGPAVAGMTFQIAAEESEARFVVEEVLAGAPKTVVGTTNGVSGEIVADYANPAGAEVSALRVDLSGLATDDDFRNRALHSRILETGNPDFQFAEFRSTSISGLPDSVTLGESYPLQITGDLSLHGVTREVTFEATVTPVSETRLEGSASTTVRYADFDVHILSLPPQVASVEDSARLEIDLVAVAG